jgi:hypothetical protein
MTNRLIVIAAFAFVTTSLSCHNVTQLTNTQRVTQSSAPTTTLRFPQPWLDETEGFASIQQIEVRKLPNATDDEFFFAALPDGDHFYAHEVDKNIPKPRYGKNMFAVSFANGLRVRVATQQEWESGSRIATKPRYIFQKGNDFSSGEIEYRQQRYAKPGKYWSNSSLSPSGKWLAAFSYTGEKPPPDLFGQGTPREGDIFWQIYDTVTGKKVFEWEAKNVKSPAELSGPVVWLEDRYFLFPEDKQAQNLLVVTLPPFTPEVNPVTVQFPSRKDASGQWMPAGDRDEVWIPLVPLTKEQAAKLTAPYPTEITEARLLGQPMPKELLFAINEETENRRANRQGRDGAGDYHYKVVSTYYYAMALDNPAQTRFASKQEWESGRRVRIDRSIGATTPVGDTVKSTYPPYRQFARLGTTWGTPAVLFAGEWIAVFSYGDDGIFVDVYNQRLGHKLLSTTLPLTASPNELFKGALWIEGGYILLPLNARLDSFALWQLPGGV